MNSSPVPVSDGAEHTVVDRFAKLAAFGSELFRDPLGETSRKRQTYLLIVSVLAILLSFGTVGVPSSGGAVSAFGFTLSISSAASITTLFGCLTVYFWVAFGMSVCQDLIAARCLRTPLLAYVQQLSAKTIRWIGQQERRATLTSSYLDRLNELGRIRDRYEVRETQRRRELGTLERQMDDGDTGAGVHEAFKAKVKALMDLEAQREVEERPVRRQMAAYQEQLAELDAAGQDPSARPVTGELDAYARMYETYRTVDMWRFGLEVAAPMVVGIYAMSRSFLA